MPDLNYYYKRGTVYPFGFTMLCGIVLSITHDGSDYKSEWFATDGFVETVVLTIVLSGVICLLSLTILLNQKPLIRKIPLLSFLSWFLGGGTMCIYVVYLEMLNFMQKAGYEGNRLLDGFIMAVGIVHLIFLALSFRDFRRRLNAVS